MSISTEETIVNESQDIKRSLSRRQSERHQVMKVQNYVIYRKTIGAGSMGKVKLAECLTDPTKQKVIKRKKDKKKEAKNKSIN